jgi:hypothetical protein
MDGHLNWTEKFETMGYIRKDVVQNKSRDTVNQYIHKLMNPSDPNHFEYGDVCVYWALDPNPSLPLNYAGFTNNNNAAWNYGHAQIWVGDINKGIMTDFPPGGALGPKAVGWASSTKANYGSYDGFVYRHVTQPDGLFQFIKLQVMLVVLILMVVIYNKKTYVYTIFTI